MIATTLKETNLGALLAESDWHSQLSLSELDYRRMAESVETLQHAIARGQKVYGVTQGFGPLVKYEASASREDQGLGLISHLASGQGEALLPQVTRYMLWLRLKGMTRGYSAVPPQAWNRLAAFWNRGFTPVIPRDGSISASGDLVPLAHAALAFAGIGEAWVYEDGTGWAQAPAREVLASLKLEPYVWSAREALAFVNGTTASLAVVSVNHQSILSMARCLAALSGRISFLLRTNQQPYAPGVGLVRGQPGQMQAAEWIREELRSVATLEPNPGRPLQEIYSLRCAPQVIGAVLDQLAAQEDILWHESQGCTDNPIVFEDSVLHAGNFHAMPVAFCSDTQALCLHQLAFLAERQLGLLVDPVHNGNKPPLLTPTPGPQSGFAGVQIAATSFVAKIRQLAHPATLTALPTNLGNQDHVPMALNGANTVSDLCQYGWLVLASLALAITQWTHLDGQQADSESLWGQLQELFEPLDKDRPLAPEVRRAATLLQDYFNPFSAHGSSQDN
ncbi:MAG TPA: aromatic amino acid ammonia-lyase [Chloroflexia bacterium]|nr:aromatic amino acid ammonia-lyase [Chloroflexia bacterium]